MSLLNLYDKWVEYLKIIEETSEYLAADQFIEIKNDLKYAIVAFKILSQQILAIPNISTEVTNIVKLYQNVDHYNYITTEKEMVYIITKI